MAWARAPPGPGAERLRASRCFAVRTHAPTETAATPARTGSRSRRPSYHHCFGRSRHLSKYASSGWKSVSSHYAVRSEWCGWSPGPGASSRLAVSPASEAWAAMGRSEESTFSPSVMRRPLRGDDLLTRHWYFQRCFSRSLPSTAARARGRQPLRANVRRGTMREDIGDTMDPRPPGPQSGSTALTPRSPWHGRGRLLAGNSRVECAPTCRRARPCRLIERRRTAAVVEHRPPRHPRLDP